MALLTGTQAATFADLAYDTASATTASAATARADMSMQALQKKDSSMQGFSTNTGFAGESGAFVSKPGQDGLGLGALSSAFGLRDVSGFGAVFERKVLNSKELVIAFRGTQSTPDWMSNLNTGMETGPGGAIVHAGFNRLYGRLSDALHDAVSKAQPDSVHFVGHSLGGALATLAMADFGLSSGGKPCHLYTFGAPRVGGFGLSSQLRTLLTPGTVRRVYAVSDPVPMIPLLPYQHFMPGATGVNMGYTYITAAAHDRINYRNQMPQNGWPAATPLPVKSDPDYWLDMAEKSSGFSSFGYYALSMALSGIMKFLNALGLGISVGTTVLDRMIEAMNQAALLARKMGELTLRFVKAALKLVGRAAMAATASLADLTQTFLRAVFEMLLRPVAAAARTAVSRIV